jgi:ribosome-binding factor A
MAERRPERVAHLVQAELARLLLTAMRDPRLRDATVTGVRMTPDLRVAHVYVRTLGAEAESGALLAALGKAAPFLRGEIGRALHLRLTPELRFEYDVAPDRARRVDALLRQAATPPRETEDDE